MLLELVDKFGGQQERHCPALLFGGCQIFGGVSKKSFEKCRRTKSCTRRVLAAVQKQAEAGRYMKTFILALILTQSTRSSVTESLLLRKARLGEEMLSVFITTLTFCFHFSRWGLHRVVTSCIR